MAKLSNQAAVLTLPRNFEGRDFVAGDVHGCYSSLMAGLRLAGFRSDVDRLVLVGDVLDRGPEPMLMMELLDEPWVFSTAGNHEALARSTADLAFNKEALQWGQAAGASWWSRVSPSLKNAYRKKLASLPLAIEIPTRRGLVGVVHADVPTNMSWPELKRKLVDGCPATVNTVLQGRSRVKHAVCSEIGGVWRVYAGHQPTKFNPAGLANYMPLDTGLVYRELGVDPQGHLTVFEATAEWDPLNVRRNANTVVVLDAQQGQWRDLE